MYVFRVNLKRISIWIFFVIQLLLITTYFYFEPVTDATKNDKINFIMNTDFDEHNIVTYHTLRNRINLKTVNTVGSYVNFNSSLCYLNGTDVRWMNRSKENWNCKCLPGWHGIDCGQPEILWRALLALRKPTNVKGPRTFQRRLIYLFKVDKFSETIADVRITELGNIVDLFILYENENSNYLQSRLNNNFAKSIHHKILYVRSNQKNVWLTVKYHIRNLRKDDIILSSNSNEIPNKYALNFLKLYDHWPQPIRFRLRWSVYGFFWVHPSKTMITGGACTVAYINDTFNNNINLLLDNKTLSSPLYKGVILGDLNHSGGWFCEYCSDSGLIVEYLATKPKIPINWDNLYKQKIDNNYIEDLIENGLYIDGKLELQRAHRYHDPDFAPTSALESNWKYDFLLINLYSKMDYYDG